MKPTVKLSYILESHLESLTLLAKFSCTLIKLCPYCKALLCVDRFVKPSDFVLAYMILKVIRNPIQQ